MTRSSADVSRLRRTPRECSIYPHQRQFVLLLHRPPTSVCTTLPRPHSPTWADHRGVCVCVCQKQSRRSRLTPRSTLPASLPALVVVLLSQIRGYNLEWLEQVADSVVFGKMVGCPWWSGLLASALTLLPNHEATKKVMASDDKLKVRYWLLQFMVWLASPFRRLGSPCSAVWSQVESLADHCRFIAVVFFICLGEWCFVTCLAHHLECLIGDLKASVSAGWLESSASPPPRTWVP